MVAVVLMTMLDGDGGDEYGAVNDNSDHAGP